MSLTERMLGLAEKIEGFNATNLRAYSEAAQSSTENLMLKRALFTFAEAIQRNSQDQTYRPIMRDRLILSLFQGLVRNAQLHPNFKNIIGVQISEELVALEEGTLIEKAEALSKGPILTLEDMARL